MMSKTLAKHRTEMMLAKVAVRYFKHRLVWCTFFVISCCVNNEKQEKENTSLMPLPQKNLELSFSFPSSVWLEFKIRSSAIRVGCLSSFLYSPQTASQSIFFKSISLPSYEGSLMFQAFRYPWRMPRGFPCHVKVLSCTVALMPFLNGLCSALGGEQTTKTCKHKNYWPMTLFKVYEMLSVPLGQPMPWPHNINGLFHCRGCLKKVLFMLFSFFCFVLIIFFSLALKSCCIWNNFISM